MSEAGPFVYMDAFGISHYERLIFKHAMRVTGIVEMDFDDIQQVYRVKVWKALESFDEVRFGGRPLHRPGASTCRCRQCRYVFLCLKNMEKDLLKRKRRGDLYIEDIAPTGSIEASGLQSRDRFESRYLSAGADEVYGSVEDEPVLLPSTLSQRERRIVVLLYRDFSQAEIRRDLGLERSEMDRTVKSIRLKFEDWRPSGAPPTPLPPLALAA